MKKLILLITAILLTVSPAFSDTSTTSYDDIDFPQWTKDLRRTEIITFGSLPFVTIWATVGYNLYQYGEFRNPLNKSADGFTADDQKTIVAISAATCIGLGLFDLTLNLIQRSAKEHKAKKNRKAEVITITSEKQRLADMEREKKEKGPDQKPPRPQEYLSGEIFSALF